MTFDPINISSLVQALAWPLVVLVGLTLYRNAFIGLAGFLGKRVRKVSFADASIELAEVSEVSANAIDTEIRELNSTLYPNSGASGISNILSQIQVSGQHDYIVIDLGDQVHPRWLSSRLYLISFLTSLVKSSVVLVFVETRNGIRKCYIGTCFPEEVRKSLARSYPWLESACASAYAQLGELQFDPGTSNLVGWQTNQLIQNFIDKVRPQSTPSSLNDTSEWVALTNGTFEHAKWIDGSKLERILGSNLNLSHVIQIPEKSLNALTGNVLRQRGQFVAIVEPDKRFHSLVDRNALLEKLGEIYSNSD